MDSGEMGRQLLNDPSHYTPGVLDRQNADTRFSLAVVAIALCACSAPEPPGLAHLSVPEGFEVVVAAAPPLVERPMIVDMDDEGRLYVAESSGSNAPVEEQLAEKPHCILRLEDRDGDGVYDSRTVFADKLMLPEGVLWTKDAVYVTAPPVIWKLVDADDDGVAEHREVWYDAKTLTNCANDLHGPYEGLDGWIYWTKGSFAEQTHEITDGSTLVTRAAHVFRRRPEGGPIEAVLTGGMNNPVEVAFLPTGERMLTSTFLQFPELGRRDGVIHAIYGGVYGRVHRAAEAHPMTGGYLDPISHLGPAAPVGLAALESEALGFKGTNLVSTTFNTHKVLRHRLTPKGATFESEDSDLLVSSDADFHPTDVMEDADGSLLVVDTGGWYKLCCPTSQLAKADVPGAIYRVRRKGMTPQKDPRGTELAWDVAATELAERLDDARPFVRDRALRELAGMGASAVSALSSVDRSATARRNAVWALTQIDAPEARAAVRKALADEDESVRHAAAHGASVWRDSEATPALLSLLEQSKPLRRVAAEALGRIRDAEAVEELLAFAADADEQVLAHSLTFALIEIADPEATRAGLRSASPRTRRAALLALDQMRPSALEPHTVVPLLTSNDELLRETASWIAGRRLEWGAELARPFAARLTAGDESVEDQLVRFAESPQIRTVVARAAESGSPASRPIALRVMSRALLKERPKEWDDALTRILRDATGETAEAAVRAANTLKMPSHQLRTSLLAVSENEGVGPRTKVEALETALSDADETPPSAFAFLVDSLDANQGADTRVAAARALAGIPLDDAQRFELAESLTETGPAELPRVLDAFASGGSAELGEALLTSLEQSRGSPGLQPGSVEALFAAFPASLAERAQALANSLDADRAEQTERLESLLASLPEGDVRRGQAVFNAEKTACISCHAIGFEGGKVGPGLTTIGQIRERRDLLEAVLYPSASFVTSYEPVIVETQDDIYSGVTVEETEGWIVLATGAEERARIPREQIEEVRPGRVSVMPAGLDAELSTQELADLLAFLEGTQRGPSD